MYDLFKTVFILSLFGFAITVMLLCLKPVTAKKFPAKWQYYVWVAVLFSMLIPAYKLVPQKEAQKISLLSQNRMEQQEQVQVQMPDNPETVTIAGAPIAYREVTLTPKLQIKLLDLIAYIWFLGGCLFLIVVITSYVIYTARRRQGALELTENLILDEVRTELKIKRHIKIRMSPEIQSPLLVGVLFPVVYIPCKEISDTNMRMVLLHELTHYKRKDLLIKWLSLFVNAVHWFNPLAYLLRVNVSESCEVSCDMEVTKNMSVEEQKQYMKTILDLVEEREEK